MVVGPDKNGIPVAGSMQTRTSFWFGFKARARRIAAKVLLDINVSRLDVNASNRHRLRSHNLFVLLKLTTGKGLLCSSTNDFVTPLYNVRIFRV